MKEIELGGGEVALVDDADFESLSKHKWYVSISKGRKYARRRGWTDSGSHKISMHRAILKCQGLVDHKDGNGLNNTRANLREATGSQNNQNAKKPSHGKTSKYKGVSLRKDRNMYRSNIKANGLSLYIGQFQNEVDAAWAYDREARRLFGEFSKCNFPPPPAIIYRQSGT